jgi:hypothetical protein
MFLTVLNLIFAPCPGLPKSLFTSSTSFIPRWYGNMWVFVLAQRMFYKQSLG